MRSYLKPVLTCYASPDIGYTSASNSNATCQAACAANNCDFVADCSAAPCAQCDTTDANCGTGIVPAVDCRPLGC